MLHVVLMWGLSGGALKRPADDRKTYVELVTVAPPPVPPPIMREAPAPQPPPQVRRRSVPVARTARPSPKPPPAAAQVANVAPAPPDSTPSEVPPELTLPVLSAETGPGVATTSATSLAQGSASASPQPPGASQLVPAKDLGRGPRASRLDAALERNYPREARWSRITGSVVLRLQITSDGRISAVRIISATHADFGAACERTVRSALWQPAQDRQGRAVATEITYTCRFELRD